MVELSVLSSLCTTFHGNYMQKVWSWRFSCTHARMFEGFVLWGGVFNFPDSIVMWSDMSLARQTQCLCVCVCMHVCVCVCLGGGVGWVEWERSGRRKTGGGGGVVDGCIPSLFLPLECSWNPSSTPLLAPPTLPPPHVMLHTHTHTHTHTPTCSHCLVTLTIKYAAACSNLSSWFVPSSTER